MPDLSWMDRARCKGMDTELFFPPAHAYASAALAICRRCPVAQKCLDWAIAQPDHVQGVWGGKTQHQRARIRNGSKNHNAVKTQCVNGHPFDEENTYVRPKTGTRMCRTCQRASEARWRQRREAVSA